VSETHAKAQAAQNPARQVIAVLATDGLPTECAAPNTPGPAEAIEQVAQLAADGLAGSPAVETYVVGVFSPDDANAMQNLETIATAGGSDTPLIVDPARDVNAQFRAALEAIRIGARSCRFALPDAPGGRTLDLGTVELKLRSFGGEQTLTKVGGEDGCGAAALGWFFTTSAGSTAPAPIQLCASSCDALQAADHGEIALQIGCEP